MASALADASALGATASNGSPLCWLSPRAAAGSFARNPPLRSALCGPLRLRAASSLTSAVQPKAAPWPDEDKDAELEEIEVELESRGIAAGLDEDDVQEDGDKTGETDSEEDGDKGEADSDVDEEIESIRRSIGPELAAALEEEDWDEEELDKLFEEYGETVHEYGTTAGKENQLGVPGTETGSPMGGEIKALFEAPQNECGEAVAESDLPVGGESQLEAPVARDRLGSPATDEESQELAVALAVAASDTKAGNVRVLDVRALVYWTQFFVVATAFSRPQMDAVAKRMSDVAELTYGRSLKAAERLPPGPWTLLDYGDVVVHLFAPRERERYAIEEFYANAREVPLPFVETPSNYY